MDFDEVVEDVEGGVESFFVNGRIVLETREIAYKHLGNVFRDLGTRGEKPLPLYRSDLQPRLSYPLRSFHRLLSRLLKGMGSEKGIQQFDYIRRNDNVVVDKKIRQGADKVQFHQSWIYLRFCGKDTAFFDLFVKSIFAVLKSTFKVSKRTTSKDPSHISFASFGFR